MIQHAKKTDLHVYMDYLVNTSVSLQISRCFVVTTFSFAGIDVSFFPPLAVLLCVSFFHHFSSVSAYTLFEFVASVSCVERCSFKKENYRVFLNKKPGRNCTFKGFSYFFKERKKFYLKFKKAPLNALIWHKQFFNKSVMIF